MSGLYNFVKYLPKIYISLFLDLSKIQYLIRLRLKLTLISECTSCFLFVLEIGQVINICYILFLFANVDVG